MRTSMIARSGRCRAARVVSDRQAAHAFYRGVFGWRFKIGRAGGAHVTGVAPQIGITTQPEAGPATPGVILGYRVKDITAAVTRVREAGGQARKVAQRPTDWSHCASTTKAPLFYLHQLSGQ
jgi:predicted enzyme related to lactoylglutathione lyase